MKYMTVGNELEGASQLIWVACDWQSMILKRSFPFLKQHLEVGINFFDHSDVYAGGQSEAKFAQALRSAKIPRDQVLIQSKCGLRDVHTNYHFDFSKDYIIRSVEGSLERLQTAI